MQMTNSSIEEERDMHNQISIIDTRLLALVTALAFCGVGTIGAQSAKPPSLKRNAPRIVKLTEVHIRGAAKNKPMPSYPLASLEKRITGVAVATIVVGFDGRMEAVNILEAPDPLIGEAVRNALFQWVFHSVKVKDSEETWKIEGKLTFYFRIADGNGQVLFPEEVPAKDKVNSKTDGKATETPQQVDEAGLAQLIGGPTRPVIVDIRDRAAYKRGHRQGAVNIPRDELHIRARAELQPSKTVVIDCSTLPSDVCAAAASRLQQLGFADVTLLVGGGRH